MKQPESSNDRLFDIEKHLQGVEEKAVAELAERFREIWATTPSETVFEALAREALTHDQFCVVMVREVDRILRSYHEYIDTLESGVLRT